jgi:AhpD family alkylhydroperoxidase
MIMDRGSKKKVYGSWRELFADFGFIIRNTRMITRVYRGRLVPAAFRERLMVAVTSVYRCRFCSWYHTREALRTGVAKEEVARLLTGVMEDCPEEYSIAVLYAQHWADSNANPDLEAVRRLEDTYGTERAKAINVVLHLVRCGNLMMEPVGKFMELPSPRNLLRQRRDRKDGE